jgi:hypothetical protein
VYVPVAPHISSVVDSHKEGNGVLVSVEGEIVTMLLHAISICLWGVEDTNTLPGSQAQSSDQSPTQSEAALIRQGLKRFMMFNRDLLFLHYTAAERRFNATLLGGIFDMLQCTHMLVAALLWLRMVYYAIIFINSKPVDISGCPHYPL